MSFALPDTVEIRGDTLAELSESIAYYKTLGYVADEPRSDRAGGYTVILRRIK